jgi:hypothetical protein
MGLVGATPPFPPPPPPRPLSSIFPPVSSPPTHSLRLLVKKLRDRFGLFANAAKTKAGQLLLRRYLMFPSTDQVAIYERQNHISYLIAPTNQSFFEKLGHLLSFLNGIPRVLTKFRTFRNSMVDWSSLTEILDHLIRY